MKLIPIAVFAALFFWLSARLLRIGSRGEGQERWLATFFASAGLALPTRLIAVDALVAGHAYAGGLNLVGHTLMSASTAAILMFVWRVFRPEDAWAKGLTIAMVGLQIVLVPAVGMLGGHLNEALPIVVFANFTRALPFLWAFVESRRYHRMMSRRVELGIADPVVSNRFALFSVWTGALFLLPGVAVSLRAFMLVQGIADPLQAEPGTIDWALPLMRAVMVVGGVLAAVSIWLSFFPPRSYVDRIVARAGTVRTASAT